MLQWIRNYDMTLARKRPVLWMCRVHILLPLMLILYVLSVMIGFALPIWSNFKVIIFINIFFSITIIIAWARFQYLYHEKALNIRQHYQIFLYNICFLALLSLFIFLCPAILEKRIELSIGKVVRNSPKEYILQDSAQLAFRKNNAADTIQMARPRQTGKNNNHPWYDPNTNRHYDHSSLNSIDYHAFEENFQLIMLSRLDSNDIKKIKPTLDSFFIQNQNINPEYPVSNSGILNLAFKKLNPDSIPDLYNGAMSEYVQSCKDILLRACYDYTGSPDIIKTLSDSILLKYGISIKNPEGFRNLITGFGPSLFEKINAISHNSEKIYNDVNIYNQVMMILFLIFLIGTYIIIILMSQNKYLGFTSIFIFLFLVIFIYSIANLRSMEGYLKYFMFTCTTVFIGLLVLLLSNSRIRNGYISQAFIYILHFLFHLVFCTYVFLYYTEQDNELAQNPADKWWFILQHLIIFMLYILLNFPFLNFYYRKLIRPGK